MRRTSLLMIALLFALLPGAAAAQDPDTASDGNFTLRINEDITIGAHERIDTLVVINADVEVQGTIENALIVIQGTATVVDGGRILESATIVSGDLVLNDGSEVDNVSLVRSDLEQAEGATVLGDVDRTSRILFLGWGTAILAGVVFWIGVTLAVLAAGVVFALVGGRQLATSAAYMTERVGQSILTGLVVMIGMPILAVVLLVTLVGIPAGLGLLVFVLPALLVLGYIVAGTWLGSLILSRNEPKPTDRPVTQALLGLAILQLLLAVPVLGWVLFPVAGTWGAGALMYYAFNALRGLPQRRQETAAETT